MKKNKRVLCINADIESTNLGCAALGLSFIQVIKEIAQENNWNVIIDIIGYGKGEPYEDDCVSINAPQYFDIRKRDFWTYFKESVKQADLIVDFTGGDSFTDIYGMRRFIRESIVKEKALKSKKCFLLGPQTIGPFTNPLAKRIAKHQILLADFVFARDEVSYNYVKNLGCDCILTTDVAFMLLPTEGKYDLSKTHSSQRFGLNVSGLLYNGGYNNNNQFELKMDYKMFVNQLVKELTGLGYEIHLIPHVLPLRSPTEDDYKVAQIIHEEFPNTIIAPRFSSPKEAKEYICNMDFFVGSRMHATIAAFSMGIPTVPVAYSPKFFRLYSSLGYNRVIDGKDVDENEAVAYIIDCIQDIEAIKSENSKSMELAKERNIEFKEKIQQILNR